MTQAKASVINYDRNSRIKVLATVITIVNYDSNSFIIQATDVGLKITNIRLSWIKMAMTKPVPYFFTESVAKKFYSIGLRLAMLSSFY
jgi:hypothetical protein